MIIRFFSLNLEFICTCEFYKKLKLHSPKLVQIKSKLISKPYDYLYNKRPRGLHAEVFFYVCSDIIGFLWRMRPSNKIKSKCWMLFSKGKIKRKSYSFYDCFLWEAGAYLHSLGPLNFCGKKSLHFFLALCYDDIYDRTSARVGTKRGPPPLLIRTLHWSPFWTPSRSLFFERRLPSQPSVLKW